MRSPISDPVRLVVLALGLAVTFGCATQSPDDDVSVARAHDDSVIDDLRARAHQRGKVIGGERVTRSIAWPTNERIDVTTRDALPLAARDAIARAPVPVIVPPGHDDATVVVGEHWAAVSVHGEGYTIHVQGSGEARVHPHVRAIEPTHPVRAGDGFVTRNEGVWSFSWIEHGAAYVANVECDARTVGWCDDEAAIAELVGGFVVVGGKAVAP